MSKLTHPNHFRRRFPASAALAAFLVAGGGGLLADDCPSHDAAASVDHHGSPASKGTDNERASHEAPGDEQEHDACTCVDACCQSAGIHAASIPSTPGRPVDVETAVASLASVTPDGVEAPYLLPFANAPPLLV